MVIKSTGIWSWLLQRITGALLIVVLLIHYWALHGDLKETITFESVLMRISSPFFLVLDICLLGLSLYHGLNGIWVIIMDFGVKGLGKKVAFAGIFIIGIVFFILGVIALNAFFAGVRT